MKRRNLNRGAFRFERFEDRRLLAADLAAAMVGCDAPPVEQCEVASIEDSAIETLEELDLDATNVGADLTETDGADLPVDQVIGAPDDGSLEPALEPAIEDLEEDNLGGELNETQGLDADVHDLGDPVDGTDGFFGMLDQDSPSQAFTVTPSENGMLEVVLSNSLADAQIELEVTDQDGHVYDDVSIEDLGQFQTFSFEADANETFVLTVSATDGATGQFQLTSSHSEIPAATDLHANEIGDDSTELNFVDGASELTGELETVGDVDTFRFSADGTGRATLNLAELNPDNATELQVEVFDADGESIARGITNENVGISFNTEAEGDYFVAVSAGPDQLGSYEMNLTVAPATAEEVRTGDLHVDDIGENATELTLDGNVAAVSGDLEVGEDRDAFQFVAPGDGEVTIALTATSDGYSSDASVAAFDADGQPIVVGTTNDDVALRFEVAADQPVQLLVDSLNDVPAAYELVATFLEETEPVVESSVSTDDLGAPVVDVEVETLAGEIDSQLVGGGSDGTMETCFDGDAVDNDASGQITAAELVDAAFSSFASQDLLSDPSLLS